MTDRYRKKPVEVRAWKIGFDGQEPDWVREAFDDERIDWCPAGEGLYISTLEGDMKACIGDMLIEGVKGELYGCRADIFAATYEPVETTPATLPQEPQAPAQWGDPAIAAILGYLRNEIGFASFARDLSAHIDQLAAENERLREEGERLRGLVVSRFDQDSPPTFRQGTPEHELEDPVTAEQCAWFVAEIKRLRAENERLHEQLRLATVDQVNAEAEASDAHAENKRLQESLAALEQEAGRG